MNELIMGLLNQKRPPSSKVWRVIQCSRCGSKAHDGWFNPITPSVITRLHLGIFPTHDRLQCDSMKLQRPLLHLCDDLLLQASRISLSERVHRPFCIIVDESDGSLSSGDKDIHQICIQGRKGVGESDEPCGSHACPMAILLGLVHVHDAWR